MIKLAPEGFPFIIGSLVLTVIVLFAFAPATCVPLLLTAFMVYFFRDPARSIPRGKGLFVSPADGTVVLIKDTREEKYLHADVKQISIFMSPFNVHVNRVPCDGIVKTIRHNKGIFVAAYKEEASVKNENIEMVLGTDHGDILVRQVAGMVARRAVCRKREGDELTRGERYGIIKFSSRVDLYIPKDVAIKVEIHDKVIAGETILAELKTGDSETV
jgi:phosphatidylserine decarboxylase